MIQMNFGVKLKEYREKAGLSQQDLARAASLDKASINRFESGQRSPSERARVEDICAALKVEGAQRDALLWSAAYLPGVYDTVAPTDPTLLAVARALAGTGLSERERVELRTVVETVANRWAGVAEKGGRA